MHLMKLHRVLALMKKKMEIEVREKRIQAYMCVVAEIGIASSLLMLGFGEIRVAWGRR